MEAMKEDQMEIVDLEVVRANVKSSADGLDGKKKERTKERTSEPERRITDITQME